jgi:acyl-CoA thioesterase FadM/ketosteroid isomerase-like protein
MVEVAEAQALELTVEATVEPRFLDAMGHMNVAWYVYLFDRGVWEFFERHGLDERYLRGAARGMFALEENLRYLSELREAEPLTVHTGVLELKPKTVRLLQYMVDTKRQKIAAVREVVAAHIDLATRRSTTFTESVMAQLQAAPPAAPAGGAMSEAAAQAFARAWIAAWNRRDVEAVLAHFAEDAVFFSPKAEQIVGSGRVEGKAALRAYWNKALEQARGLHFELEEAVWSPRAETLTVIYVSAVEGRAPVHTTEIMRFKNGHVVLGRALYGATASQPA